jgi:putative phosphoesterase
MDIQLPEKDEYTVGVISDTHGIVRPTAVRAFKGVDLIIHAGDIGKASVITELEKTAPLVAVRGNMDSVSWAGRLSETETVRLGGTCILVLHQLEHLPPDWQERGYDCIIFGHEHEPILKEEEKIIFLNPGCAGEASSPATAAFLNIRGSGMQAKFVTLD